ncbi:MAG: hypothetical protein N838_25550 [Thiohalocapsa sp. PB-PSB1]|nr:MAG: hypothetical protein N838_25550 [Thiohalocapsa sp. PB-PSB1]
MIFQNQQVAIKQLQDLFLKDYRPASSLELTAHVISFKMQDQASSISNSQCKRVALAFFGGLYHKPV